jgi:hypothetical protein
MYIRDLTPYIYDQRPKKNELAIGWLDDVNFSKGIVPKGFLKKLNNAKIIHHHKGSHDCPFCEISKSGSSAETKGSEVHSIIQGKITYIFPSLLKHYIKVHHYLPPQEFIDAIMTSLH